MIVYRDKCWCDAKHCKKYEVCRYALPYAMTEQTKHESNVRKHLPYDVTDMSKRCKEYEDVEN